MPVDEIHVNNNEYLPKGVESKAAFKPRLKNKGAEDGDNDSAEESDENFDWYDALECEKDSYFVMLSQERKPILKGQQAFNSYGDRSNRFLLVNYGFCFAGNRYDSFEFRMKLDVDLSDLFVPFLVDFSD
jgi:hypothetical protein